MTTIRSKFLFTGLAAVLLSASLPVLANEAYVGYRQKIMAAVGGHAGAIGAIVKSKLPEQDAIAALAEAVAKTADTVPAAFSHALHEGATDAKPEIWDNMDDFLTLNDAMRKASLALADAARKGDPAVVKKAMRDFSKSCGACHRSYRKPKEESYKQRR